MKPTEISGLLLCTGLVRPCDCEYSAEHFSGKRRAPEFRASPTGPQNEPVNENIEVGLKNSTPADPDSGPDFSRPPKALQPAPIRKGLRNRARRLPSSRLPPQRPSSPVKPPPTTAPVVSRQAASHCAPHHTSSSGSASCHTIVARRHSARRPVIVRLSAAVHPTRVARRGTTTRPRTQCECWWHRQPWR
jgi:hypothetical protein